MPKVNVQQKDGEIVINEGGGDDARTYKVTDGQVTVAEKDVERFLLLVDGSKVAGGSTTGTATRKDS